MSQNYNISSILKRYYFNYFTLKPRLENPKWRLNPSELKNAKIRWTNKYEWEGVPNWTDTLLWGFYKHLPVEIVDDIPQPYQGTVIFQFVVEGKAHDVAIGYSDYMPIDEDCAKQCELYFKMQYAQEGYGHQHIVPGGYVPDSKSLYVYLNKFRKIRSDIEPTIDVIGRFGLDYSREIREKATNILKEQKSFNFEGGMKKVSYKEFLEEAARAKICIDLPGLGDFCFRLVNYLSIGSCIVASPHRTILHEPLIDRKHIVYSKADFSDLVELCEYYLENESERIEIVNNSRDYFDLNLHKDNLVKYYLRTCFDFLRK